MIPRLKYLLSTILFSFSLKPIQVLTTPFLYSRTPRRRPRPRLPLRSPPWGTDGSLVQLVMFSEGALREVREMMHCCIDVFFKF